MDDTGLGLGLGEDRHMGLEEAGTESARLQAYMYMHSSASPSSAVT